MAEKTAVELALSSISWQLKRIADSLEGIDTTLEATVHPTVYINPSLDKGTNKIQAMLNKLNGLKGDGSDD
jgi:hypothetical protein